MRYTYTAVITQENGKFYARVPDVAGCVTTGRSVEDAVLQITDALSGCLGLGGRGAPHPGCYPAVRHCPWPGRYPDTGKR